jgi:hypothetical protein
LHPQKVTQTEKCLEQQILLMLEEQRLVEMGRIIERQK